MVLRQILQLDQPASPAPGAVGTIELEHASAPTVSADTVLHGDVFFHTRPGKLLTEFQRLGQFRRCGLQQFLHGFLVQGIHLHPMIRQPLLHLSHRIRVLQLCQLLHFSGKLIAGLGIQLDGLLDHLPIQADASVVDLLGQVIFLPDGIRHRELGQHLLDGHLHLHIALVVRLEGGPLVWRMLRAVPEPAAVDLRRLAGHGEVFDQRLALCHLLILQLQHCADALQRQRQANVCRPDQGAFPRCRVQIIGNAVFRYAIAAEQIRPVLPQPRRQTNPLKRRIERPLRHGLIHDGPQHFFRDLLPAGHIDDGHLAAVDRVTEQQDVKLRVFRISVHTALGKIGA
ncbi:MAG: hypothetical protein BWY83_00682 [bacterium ADurb.Bin478]|nr:MAG: hypothetical protein BWY83_00682 [bacterium ADurb.Bin478]